ncbi:MAG: hypothetical protein GX358_10825 [candidate division WS1 bacterium]|nr:hypothetical protein [candidate division WS1 bacterium]
MKRAHSKSRRESAEAGTSNSSEEFPQPLPFELRVVNIRDNEVALEVWQESINGWPWRRAEPKRVARIRNVALHFAWEELMLMLQRLGVRSLNLSPARRDRTLRVHEEVGVRVGLMAAAVAPLRKPERIRKVAEEIRRMSYEEACYWYAHARGEDGRRALRALRIFLAPE